jgi:hypothetical protein
MEKINCDCGSFIKSYSLQSHLKSKRHLNFINGPNNNHKSFDYFKCECGSYIKKNSIFMHRLTDIHRMYLSKIDKNYIDNLKKIHLTKMKHLYNINLLEDDGYETDDKLNVYLE